MANVKGYLTIFGVTLMLFFISLFFRSPPQVASPHFLKAENAVHSFKSLHYWKRDSLDLNYWPKPVDIYDKYFTFKSWGAGFNNERISLELAFCFAFLTNRTLVMPPRYVHYNLKSFAYEDFFDTEDMKKAINVISYEDFAAREGIHNDFANIKEYATPINWTEIASNKGIFVYPTKSVSDPQDLMKVQLFAAGKQVWRDLSDLPNEKILHFVKHSLFNPFYVYFYTLDHQLDNYLKKMIREHVHFKTEIFNVAQSYIMHLPPQYYAIHLRRGDFLKQYRLQDINGATLFNNIKQLIPDNATIYISTDERPEIIKEHYVSILAEKYHVITMHDIKHHYDDMYPSNWLGVIEQVICSRAVKFVGTKLSTFSSFIVRMRGYMQDISDKETYFTDTHYPDKYDDPIVFSKTYPTWAAFWNKYAIWGREYTESWEID